jgi:hydrogenase-4 component B
MIFFASGKPVLSSIAAIAALYHLLNHSIFKGLLFMGAGSILFSTHTKNIEELGGLIKKMPKSTILILIGVLSICALPPFSGFISEWLTFQSLLQGFNLNESFPRIILSISAAILALTGALAAFCFLKFFGIGFLALPRSKHAEHAKEANTPMLIGMGIFASLSILLGILPFYVLPILEMIAASFTGNLYSFTFGSFATFAIPSRMISLSTPAILAIVFIFMLILSGITFLINGKKQPVYETWGCGQPVSTSRNEYTATAFSKPVLMWFKNLYRPAREIDVTYSTSPLLKESFKFESRIEQVIEQYLYEPVVDFVIIRSRKAKMIQTGSIHAYLGYIFGTLVILFLFVIVEGNT